MSADYWKGTTTAFQNIADVKLLAEGHSLSAHKALLAANSRIFAEMFASEHDQASASIATMTEVPLHGDSLGDVALVLKHLYSSFTYKISPAPTPSFGDAKILARFAHKYDMRQMLNVCEECLISQLSYNNELHDAQTLVELTRLADQCSLHTLLAHCEFLLVAHTDGSLWHSQAVISGQVSRNSLLRILRALQMQSTSDSMHAARDRRSRRQHATVEDMLKWQQL